MIVEEVAAADLRVGDMVWLATRRRTEWAMVIAVGFDLASLAPADGIVFVFSDGTEVSLTPEDGQVWQRRPALMDGFRAEDIARAVEHAEKTVRGLQEKIGRLRRLQGLVDVVAALRKNRPPEEG